MRRFRILVPVSFGAQSDIALRQAKSLAKQINAMITCLHVIDHPGLSNGKQLSREKEQKIRLESELKLATKVNSILSGDSSVSFELIVSSGNVPWKILEKASELNMNLIIMGRSEISVRTKSLLGSITKKVIEKSDIPVLTTRNKEPHSYRHILVPLDLSAPIGLQLAKTIEVAIIFKAKVTVCTILHSGEARLETVYRRRLLEIKNLLINYGIFCRAKLVVTEKRVADVIFSCLGRYHPDIMIIMTQNESEMAKLSIGSRAKELICKSETPVFTLTPIIQKEFYPYSLLTEYIGTPISPYDPSDQLIPTD